MNKQYVVFFIFLSAVSSQLLLSQDSEESFFDDAMASTENLSDDAAVDQDASTAIDKVSNDESVKQEAQAIEEVLPTKEIKKDIKKKIKTEKTEDTEELTESKKLGFTTTRHERIGFGGKGLQKAASTSRRSKTRKSLDDIKPEERKRKYARRSGYSSKRDKDLSSRMKKVGERNARMEKRARDAGLGEKKSARRAPVVRTGRIQNPREGRVGRASRSHDETFEPTHLDRSARRAAPKFLMKREGKKESQEAFESKKRAPQIEDNFEE